MISSPVSYVISRQKSRSHLKEGQGKILEYILTVAHMNCKHMEILLLKFKSCLYSWLLNIVIINKHLLVFMFCFIYLGRRLKWLLSVARRRRRKRFTFRLFSRTNGPISILFGSKRPWLKGIEVSLNQIPLSFSRGNISNSYRTCLYNHSFA